MPAFLESKLKAEYGNNSHAIYGTMNKIGAMKGNKETAKGKEMQAKHQRDMHKHAAKHGHTGPSAHSYALGALHHQQGRHNGLTRKTQLTHHASSYGLSGPHASAYADGAMNEASGQHAESID